MHERFELQLNGTVFAIRKTGAERSGRVPQGSVAQSVTAVAGTERNMDREKRVKQQRKPAAERKGTFSKQARADEIK